MEGQIAHVHAGKIPFQQSRIFAFAAWANECERKLLGMHCGLVLDRTRHMAWARKIVGAE